MMKTPHKGNASIIIIVIIIIIIVIINIWFIYTRKNIHRGNRGEQAEHSHLKGNNACLLLRERGNIEERKLGRKKRNKKQMAQTGTLMFLSHGKSVIYNE